MPAKKASFCRLIPLLFLALCSCVKDVDIDQIDQVVIPPKAELDLVYATLEANDFSRPANSTVYQVEDVVNLEFLDDEYIKNGLVRASFTFKYTNSFETEFTNTVSFLSKSNDVKYSFSFEVPAGTVEEPTVIYYTEIIPESEIGKIRNSYRMKIAIESFPGQELSEGTLELKSKAVYEFEF